MRAVAGGEKGVKGCFPGSQWLRLRASNAGAWVQSLVRELRSHLLRGAAKKKKKNNG